MFLLQFVLVLFVCYVAVTRGEDKNSISSLEQARALQAPQVISKMGGELDHLDFWNGHYILLQNAWKEWEFLMQNEGGIRSNGHFPLLNEDNMMDPLLKNQIRQLWTEPSVQGELDLQERFWNEPIRGVHTCASLFSLQGIRFFRQHLALMRQAGIPTRRPNGMNRNGFVLDDETEGGVTYSEMDDFRGWLVDDYLRPLGRMFFPEYIGSDDDESSYAFTVHYQHDDGSLNGTAKGDLGARNTTTAANRDVRLKEHSDASAITINVNLNLPGEESEYDGPQLLFLDGTDELSQRRELELQPGMVVLHRGLHRHQALPIQKGERHQLIIWLFGKDGYVRVAPYEAEEQLAVTERWSKTAKSSRSNKLDPFEL